MTALPPPPLDHSRRTADLGADPLAPKRVLLIGGLGRSGSTLLESILGQVPGYVNVGEVVHLWERGLANDELVGDGDPFHSSPFWQQVGRRAFGGWSTLDLDDVRALHRRVDRQRYVPLMLHPPRGTAWAEDHRRWTDVLARLYRAIVEVADAQVVVDASKHSSHGFLLRSTPGVDLRVVHLVRDPRGVAHSWTKKVRRPEVTTHEEWMVQYSPARSALRWTTTNVQFHALARCGVPTMLVRYEDFAADPRGVVDDVLDFADHHPGPDALPFTGPRTVRLAATPSLAGNPLRFQGSDEVEVRRDAGWRSRLADRDRRLVTAATWPLRAVYGYDRDGAVRDVRPAVEPPSGAAAPAASDAEPGRAPTSAAASAPTTSAPTTSAPTTSAPTTSSSPDTSSGAATAAPSHRGTP